MTATITLPLWLFLLLGLLATWAVLERLLLPSVRWFFRRGANRVLTEINTHLAIEIRPFQRTKREVLIDRLLYDPQILQAAEQYSASQDMPHDIAMRRVEHYIREIVPAFNAYMYFRIGYWLSRRIAQLLYRVRIGYVDQAALGKVPENATVIFVMNHRSNMDYILVSYLAADKTALSYAVGEWARIWPLQSLIRAMGAYFVRRDSGNTLYRKVLERYVAMATNAGVPQAIYPEGGLSRDGLLREPKLGLLDYMLRGFDLDGERELIFIPVAINYDRTLEDRTLLLSQETADKKRPSTWRTIRTGTKFIAHNLRLMVQNRWHRFGYACVNFGEPISLQNYCQQRQIDFQALQQEQRFAYVTELGQELMAAIAEIMPVLPVSLISSVLVKAPQTALSELELKTQAYDLLQNLEQRGAQLYIPRTDHDYAITVGLRTLTMRHLVVEQQGLFMVQEKELPLLQYYANAIAHLLP